MYDYDPFGKPLRVSEPEEDLNPFRSSTKYTDVETGLCYYGYRYYDAMRGRWINRDPIEERGGVNLYGMVGNDSVNRVDVLGKHTFQGCSDEQKMKLNAAINDARLAVTRSLSRLENLQTAGDVTQHQINGKTTGGLQLRNEFIGSFGVFTQGALDRVKGNFTKTKEKLNDVNITLECRCQCENPKWGAYVHPGGEHRIFLCPRFCDYGAREQARMILHEETHEAFHSRDGFDLDGNGNLSDAGAAIYGPQQAKQLAQSHPDWAQNHADSYAYYAYPSVR